mmetsp:Transcript_22417/g.33615  ORF Transcript_22417/g.33615 Transcript_22417/m.33615 type:complete len:242 (-) Transcript_22417:1106-1831(-)|eukprot:CAMPEP_0116018810 /NCGR_PEP_ID=MMETSP0321-20121206/8866_1 /TAXON_ID=163516 /ORGANISM="Leptocylindrus danicus var. danicus, Strain B650" /LENGTH=241 /DNA_ID=CAMNT_0003489267 /DNA_START=80 /DNA_END=805 /DNA_ORIENTATION=+
MDLGFGNKNQVLGNLTANAILQSTKAQEEAIEDKLNKYDELLNDEDALDALRERRMKQLKNAQKQRQEYIANGHGEYSDLNPGQHGGDTVRAFFDAAKKSKRMVVHFYRPTTRYCDVVHAHLQKIATKHIETRFVKVNVETGADYLVEKLGIVVMPTMVLIKEGKVIHHLHGFDELGGTDEFSTSHLAWLLGAYEVLNYEGDAPDQVLQGKGVNSLKVARDAGISANIREGFQKDDDDEYS